MDSRPSLRPGHLAFGTLQPKVEYHANFTRAGETFDKGTRLLVGQGFTSQAGSQAGSKEFPGQPQLPTRQVSNILLEQYLSRPPATIIGQDDETFA